MTDHPRGAASQGECRSERGAADGEPVREGRLRPAAGLGLAAGAALLFFGGGMALSGSPPSWSLALLPPLAFLLPAVLLARFARAGRLVFPTADLPLRGASGGAVTLFGASLLALALAGLVARWAGPNPEEAEIWRWVAGFGPWSRIVLLALVPGLCEEVFFRGALLACLRSWGAVPACLASGLLFALFHGSPLRLLPVAVLGVALAAVVWLTGNLWMAVAGHVLHNLLVLGALEHYGASGEPGAAALALWGLGGACLLTGGGWLLSKGGS